MKYIGVWLGILCSIVACSNRSVGTRPDVHIILASETPLSLIEPSLTPHPTQTGTPTPLPSPTLAATPRRVTVSRVSDTIDFASQRLIEVGQAAPPIIFTDIDGIPYRLDQQQGRVVMINFWTVGCGSCFFEFPLFQQVRDTVGLDELLILSVNVSDFAEETRVLAQQLGVTFPMVVDPNAEIFTTFFGGAVVPTTIFIGADGVVAGSFPGPMDARLLSQRLAMLGLSVES